MVKSNAQRQAEYQRRQQEAGSYRLDAYISPDAHAALQQVVQREGISRKDAIERSILNEAKGHNMQTQFRRDDPATDPVSKPRTVKPVSKPATTARKDNSPMITINGKPVPTITENGITRMVDTTPAQTPSRPAQMTVAEHQELEKFKESLPNAIANSNAEARHVQANGGSSAMQQKERAAASFLANNMHRK